MFVSAVVVVVVLWVVYGYGAWPTGRWPREPAWSWWQQLVYGGFWLTVSVLAVVVLVSL